VFAYYLWNCSAFDRVDDEATRPQAVEIIRRRGHGQNRSSRNAPAAAALVMSVAFMRLRPRSDFQEVGWILDRIEAAYWGALRLSQELGNCAQ
jgi:hypothetical protein